MNKVILLGNLTREPELRYSNSENKTAIARFTLAVNRRVKKEGEPEADFFNCIVFGKQAEFVEKYFSKGSRMMLSGRAQNDNYTNKNGEKVYTVQILAEEIEFGERKQKNTAESPAEQQKADDDFMSIPDNIEAGLPFN